MDKQSTAPEAQLSVVTTPRRANAPKFYRIRDLDRYQHYKNRNPPWVKLHGEQLDDYYFQQLPDSVKFHALALIYLASKTGNEIPNDPAWVAARIGANEPIDFNALLQIKFLEPIRPREQVAPNQPRGKQLDLPEEEPLEESDAPDASKVLASCYQLASTETETETEGEAEAHTETAAAAPAEVGRMCVCCGKRVFSAFSFDEALRFAQHLQATGQKVGGRPIENAGGLARVFHQDGTADIEINKFLYPPPALPRREFTDEPCATCFGSKCETVQGKGARPCPDCIDEQGRRTGKRPVEQHAHSPRAP